MSPFRRDIRCSHFACLEFAMHLDDISSLGPLLLVTPWYRPTIGGVAAVTECLQELLEDSGVETFVWVCDDNARGQHLSSDTAKLRHVRIPSYAFYGFNIRTVAATFLHTPTALF